MTTYHVAAIINGRPGEIIVRASCEIEALKLAKASLPKKLRIQNAQFHVTAI